MVLPSLKEEISLAPSIMSTLEVEEDVRARKHCFAIFHKELKDLCSPELLRSLQPDWDQGRRKTCYHHRVGAASRENDQAFSAHAGGGLPCLVLGKCSSMALQDI